MNASEWNALINLSLSVLSLCASLFPMYWLRKHNGSYLNGFNLLFPGLAQSAIGCLLFGVMYGLRLFGRMTDAEVQFLARPMMVVFLLVPFTMVASLHYWRK